MGSQNEHGCTSSFTSSLASSISVPIAKSSAAASYGKKELKQSEVVIENLPIKYFEKYKINCLEDKSDANIWAGIGIATLNIVGLFTNTSIDYPEHWFLIAKASNWANEIDEIISLSRQIIKNQHMIECGNKAILSLGAKVEADTFRNYLKVIGLISKKITNLMKEYSDKCHNYFSKNNENPFDKFCLAETFKIYCSLKKKKDTKKILEDLDKFEKELSKRETKVYYLIEKYSQFKGIAKYDNTDDIFRHEKINFHNNEVSFMEKYTLERKITIKDIDNYTKTLSDSYNLIDDNCQTFVRNILGHFT